MLKIQVNDNLRAIYTYLNNYEYYVDLRDLVQFCFDYEYYKELFENFHIIFKCLEEHNIQYPERYVEHPVEEVEVEDNSLK